MDKMREEFERWAKENLRCDLSHNGEYYNHTNAYHAWQAWQASRAALVVEFTAETYFSPCKTDLELAHDDGFNSAMNSVKAALDMVGVKYE